MARKKVKPHRALHHRLSAEQVLVLNHLSSTSPDALRHVHPQRGMYGEIQPIAFGVTADGDVLVRLDRIPILNGAPYTVALLNAFPEFPACLDLVIKGWTPASELLATRTGI